MDRPLDDLISERQGRRGGARSNRQIGRKGHEDRKRTDRYETADFNSDWVHDKFEDDSYANKDRAQNSRGGSRAARESRDSAAKLRVDNLHYELTEDDLESLFKRIAPVLSLSIKYDRAGRSTGTAYVSYGSVSAANEAIREFDGANAAGQPINLTLLASAFHADHGHQSVARNPFDTAVQPGRSLFDRVEEPALRSRSGAAYRSRSPQHSRQSMLEHAAVEGIDRYVPPDRRDAQDNTSRRSPPSSLHNRRNRSPRGRVGGVRSDNSGRGRQRHGQKPGTTRQSGTNNAQPRKTQDELDQDMDAYFATKKDSKQNGGQTQTTLTGGNGASSTTVVDIGEDVDMIF